MFHDLTSPTEIRQAFLLIDAAVHERNWAAARKWIRRLVPAVDRLAMAARPPGPWLELSRCSGELGRILVREDHRSYPALFAECMEQLTSIR